MATKKVKQVKKLGQTQTSTAYTAELSFLGKKFTSTGDTPLQAIQNIKLSHGRGRGILTLSHNGTSKSRIFPPQMVTRVFQSHGLIQEIAQKNAAILFDGI